MPFSINVSITTFMYGIVVVSSADIPSISGCSVSRASRYFVTSLLIPKSTTSKPAPSIIIPTRFFPISCMSPLTVPMTIFPTLGAPVAIRSGFKIAIPPFIEFADNRTSGTKSIPSLKSFPTIVIPPTSASVRTL